MAVSNYIKGCGYSVNRLDKVVYLFPESIVKDIRVDSGAAYVTLSSNPSGYVVNSIDIENTSALDERYQFSHKVTFQVNGYVNEEFVGNKYYVAIKTVGGAYYILNPRIPCKVAYNFILGYNECHTDFTLDTVSNDATLPLSGLSLPTPKDCGFHLDGIKSLLLNEKRFTAKTPQYVLYTNDGFKTIDLGRDAIFTESFDGEKLHHSIEFNIPMDTYKQSWYYNLLEFKDNTYAALVETLNGRYFGSGFVHGLQPSYVMEGDSSESAYVKVTLELSSESSQDRFSLDDISFYKSEEYHWEYTSEHDGYECVAVNKGMYLLQKEVDVLGNETGRFKALEGYGSQFPDLNIVGTFSGYAFFNTAECISFTPRTGGTLPSTIELSSSGECKQYTFSASCDWNITVPSQSGFTVTPTSGSAFNLYTLTVCSSKTRWVDSGTTCVGYDKHTLKVEEVSFDDGTTWSATTNTRAGALIEANSVDCGYAMYRWTNSGTTCQGYDKYYLQVKEKSIDGGTTWTVVSPQETQLGSLVEAYSSDCGYVEPVFSASTDSIIYTPTAATVVDVISTDSDGNVAPFSIASQSSQLSGSVGSNYDKLYVIERDGYNSVQGSIAIVQSGSGKRITISASGYCFSFPSNDVDISNSHIGSKMYVGMTSYSGRTGNLVEYDVVSYSGGFFSAATGYYQIVVDADPSFACELTCTAEIVATGTLVLRQRGSGKQVTLTITRNF